MAEVNIATNIWTALVADTLAGRQDILNPAYKLFEQDQNILGAKAGKFNWILNASMLKSMNNITNTTTLTSNSIAQKEMEGIIIRRGDSFAETNVRRLLSGDNQLNLALAQELTGVIASQVADDLASTLTGAFASATATPLIIDLSTIVGNGSMITDANIPNIISGAYPNMNRSVMTTLICHPDVYDNITANIAKGYQIQDYIIGNLTLPRIKGLNIVYNAQLCKKLPAVEAVVGVAANGETPAIEAVVGKPERYTSYLCADNAFGYNLQRPMEIYTSFDEKVGGGTHNVTYYANYAVAPKNTIWEGSNESPSKAALETSTNWSWGYHDIQKVPLRQIVSTITPVTK